MLRMRIARAPLPEEENGTILDEYNRLTSGHIPLSEFVHWVTNSPEGAAWHAILETDEGRIVGHTCVFPLRIGYGAAGLVPAKSEYSFLHEDFRKEKISGYETAGRPAFIILLDQLFQHCQEQGWGPIFASTNEKNQVFTRKVGLRPLEFPLSECLLILKPVNAAKSTPNLKKWQHAALFATGVAHGAIWPITAGWFYSSSGVKKMPVGQEGVKTGEKLFSFFEDPASLQWRYLGGQYVRFGTAKSPEDYLIAKRGSKSSYMRVCQWRLGSAKTAMPILAALVREARADGAMGVRWAVYDGEEHAEELVRQMRRAGLLCAKRTRVMMVHKKEERFLEQSLWWLNDSLFSFDPSVVGGVTGLRAEEGRAE